MNIGIDKIGFATAQYMLNMDDLAENRDVDPDKYSKGLLLNNLSITPVNDDIVTLGASAAKSILSDQDKEDIDMVIVATESSVDQSKAAATWIHHLLGIQPFARSIEMKEACYSATAALDYARLHVQKHPESKVLVIAADVARYGANTPGEPTQGAGSIAMLISKDPRIMLLNDNSVAQTRDIMDFWRPNYSTTPFVNGIYSTKQYLSMLKTTWEEFQKRFETSLADFSAFCFHLPFPKLALKGFNKVMDKNLPEELQAKLKDNFEKSILYSKQVGNMYTGSLYLGLLSLLENSENLAAGDNIALFSYGSGAVAEIFTGTLVEGFKDMLQTSRLESLKNRIKLSVEEYEKLFFEEVEVDSEGNATVADYKTGAFALKEIREHQRIYGEVNDNK